MTIPSVVGVAAYGRDAASARVRLYHWLDRVQPDATVIGYIGSSNNRTTMLLRQPNRVLVAERRLRRLETDLTTGVVGTMIMSRRATPFGSGGIEARLFSAAQHSVYDFDDALMVQGKTAFADPRQKCLTSISKAGAVIAGNQYLADEAIRFNTSVIIIPSCIEPADYTIKRDYAVGPAPLAVWLGTPSTEPYLKRIEGALIRANRETGLRLRVIGTRHQRLGMLDAIIDRVEWEPGSFGQHLCTADFGIMPLPNDVWARGKCAYKLLQYGATGLPMIGDPVGASEGVLSITGGMAPRDLSEWAEALIELARAAPSEREALGTLARSRVVEQYSYSAWQSKWADAAGIQSQKSGNREADGGVTSLGPEGPVAQPQARTAGVPVPRLSRSRGDS